MPTGIDQGIHYLVCDTIANERLQITIAPKKISSLWRAQRREDLSTSYGHHIMNIYTSTRGLAAQQMYTTTTPAQHSTLQQYSYVNSTSHRCHP